MTSTHEYLTTEEVCGRLASAGVDEAMVGKVFASRLEPENLTQSDKKFVMGIPGPGNQAFLLVYQFGPGTPLVKASPLDEGGPDWRPRWLSVEGPFEFTLDEEGRPSADCELVVKSRELTGDA